MSVLYQPSHRFDELVGYEFEHDPFQTFDDIFFKYRMGKLQRPHNEETVDDGRANARFALLQLSCGNSDACVT